ncbi:MAG: hypothetical protein HC896_05695 [Bacteroidales bacterium]|nr:hypothetical protein [Bacteroidales bacterium]
METNYAALYQSNDRQLMKTAEDSLNPRLDRVDEIIAFAKEANIKKDWHSQLRGV